MQSLAQPVARSRVRCSIDLPTVAVAAGIYISFGLLTWFYAALPWWFVAVAGGYVVCLHGSLQHEAVHGYPSRWPWLNALVVGPSLWLWLPYTLYRDTHLAHHRDDRLTSPLDDPESNYVTPDQWARMHPLHRRLRMAMGTLLGRLVLGPPYFVVRAAARLVGKIFEGDAAYVRHWLLHLPGAAVVIVWVVPVCGIPIGEYVLLFAYPGLSLTLLRSFAEHRAKEPVAARTGVVEAGPIMGLLYLHNNLHALHHAEPGLAWHRRPRRYREREEELLAANGRYRFDGYGALFQRYLLTRKEPLIHPLEV
jgi:fatty acid desaturase